MEGNDYLVSEELWDAPEGILELSLHGLHVRVLDEEGCAELTELSDLDLAGPVLVDLGEQGGELLLGGAEAHRAHDLAEVVRGQELLLLGVEQVEADLSKDLVSANEIVMFLLKYPRIRFTQ